MKVRSDLKWIPSIYLESVNPNCTKRYCYKSLSDIHSDKNYLNKVNDSRSRSCVPSNRAREESACSIIDIINEFAPSHNVECEENDLYPSKARSQRWPLPKKKCTKLSSSLWLDTDIIINNQQITLNDNNNNNNESSTNILDDLWFAAGQTLELPPTPHEHKESEYDEEEQPMKDCKDEQQQECKYYDVDTNDNNKKSLIISNIINNLISVPFDDHSLINKGCDKLPIPRDIEDGDGITTRSSSLGSEAEINDNGENTTNYSSSNIEPSISYIIDDANTPIPPNDINTNNNTSALYEFLFDGVETDTDDDDFFGTTRIEMNYRQSVPFNIDDAKSSHDADASAADAIANGQGTAIEKVEKAQHAQGTKPGSYVACRPLWEV